MLLHCTKLPFHLLHQTLNNQCSCLMFQENVYFKSFMSRQALSNSTYRNTLNIPSFLQSSTTTFIAYPKIATNGLRLVATLIFVVAKLDSSSSFVVDVATTSSNFHCQFLPSKLDAAASFDFSRCRTQCRCKL